MEEDRPLSYVKVFFEIKRDHKWNYVIYKITDDLKNIVVEERGGTREYHIQ